MVPFGFSMRPGGSGFEPGASENVPGGDTYEVWNWKRYGVSRLPSGGSVRNVGITRPAAFWPQHTTVSSVRSPQLWNVPALTCLNVPAGGDACPKELLPQQVMVWSGRRPHTWEKPAEMWVNSPGGSVSCPPLSRPQQITVESPVWMAHAVKLPVVMYLALSPAGTVVWP
jgi:hypothetical protein